MEYLDCFHNILDIDYNPIKLNVLVSASDDSTIRFWDLRKQSNEFCSLLYNPTLA